MGAKTAGKGQVLTLRSSTGTGAIRVAPRANKREVAIEVLDAAGGITQLRLTFDETVALAEHLLKLSTPTKARARTDEVTQVNRHSK